MEEMSGIFHWVVPNWRRTRACLHDFVYRRGRTGPPSVPDRYTKRVIDPEGVQQDIGQTRARNGRYRTKLQGRRYSREWFRGEDESPPGEIPDVRGPKRTPGVVLEPKTSRRLTVVLSVW